MAKYILGANSMAVKIVGATSITLFLAPTLELDVANIAICLGNFYQELIGYDLLCGHNEALSAAMITLPGLDKPSAISWLQKKVGCVTVARMELQ